MNIDYSKITDNPKVIELLKQRTEIENKIKAIDETALIMHELELLSLPDVVGQSQQRELLIAIINFINKNYLMRELDADMIADDFESN
tara:strand:+ start:370 stop:633 length:264 start_codon:yes stop_codon:yes gene_type:complete